MAVLIRGATIITGDADRSILHDGAVLVDGNAIAAVGPSNDVARQARRAEVIDGRGKAVLPGLINAHTHVWYTVARGIQEDFGYPSTIRFPTNVTATLSAEENTAFALLGALESLRSGTTTLFEIGSRVPDYAEALARSGLRLVFGQNAADLEVRNGEFFSQPGRTDATLARLEDVVSRWHGAEDGRITAFATAHAPETCSPELLRGVSDLAERYSIGTTIHLDQSQWEVDTMLRLRGVRPTEYLARAGFLGPRLIAAHCRFMTPEEIHTLGGSGAYVAFNAPIAARRGIVPPVGALQAAGARLVTGSDNMAQDMVEVMRAALFLGRISQQDAMWPQPEDVLEWTTRTAAQALGLGDQVGSLEVGKRADLIVIDARRPHLVPTLRLVSTFVHNGQASDVESVMVDGCWLMRDRHVLCLEEPTIVDKAEAIARRAWRGLVERYPEVPFPVTLPRG